MMKLREFVDNYDYSDYDYSDYDYDDEIVMEDPMEELFDSSDLDEKDLMLLIRFLKKKHAGHHTSEAPKTKSKDHKKTHRLLRIFIIRFLKKKADAVKAAKAETKGVKVAMKKGDEE